MTMAVVATSEAGTGFGAAGGARRADGRAVGRLAPHAHIKMYRFIHGW